MDSQRTPLSLRAHNPDVIGAFLKDGVDIRVRLSGFSMKPLLRSGTVLLFSSRYAPTAGDIVLLRFPNGPEAGSDKLVAHRVLAVDGEYVWTKGDSSRVSDPPMTRSRVLGTATMLETERTRIHLRNPLIRTAGLVASAAYPTLVRWYRSVWPRKEAPPCAG